jgi:hypothetical protein
MGNLKTIMANSTPDEFEITFKGEVFKFRLRKLPWLKMTGIISKATYYDGKGSARIDMDLYYEEYLVAALAEAPWPLEETRINLRLLDADFGDLLEEHVPKPGGSESDKTSFFEKKSGQCSPDETKTT